MKLSDNPFSIATLRRSPESDDDGNAEQVETPGLPRAKISDKDVPPGRAFRLSLLCLTCFLGACAGTTPRVDREGDLACATMPLGGFRPVADDRTKRFVGKVQVDTARCRGGDDAVRLRGSPYVDWANYWGVGDAGSMADGSDAIGSHLSRNGRGIGGAVLDLEYQRIELIKFNLFANDGTYQEYVLGREGIKGPGLQVWPSMQLPAEHPAYAAVGGAGAQLCGGELIRFVILNAPPLSKRSISLTASTYRCGGALIQIAPNTATSLLGSASRNLVTGEPASKVFRSEEVGRTTFVR